MSDSKVLEAIAELKALVLSSQEESRAQFADLTVKLETAFAGDRKAKPRTRVKTDKKPKAADSKTPQQKYNNAMYFFKGMYTAGSDIVTPFVKKETVDTAMKDAKIASKKGDAQKGAVAIKIWKSFDNTTKNAIKAKFEEWAKNQEKDAVQNAEPEALSDSDK